MVIVALLAAMLVISGPVAEAVGGVLGLGGVFLTVWNIAKWPVIVLLVIVIIAVLYYATPNVRQPKLRWMSMGSLIALFAFVIASLGFGFYVANFSSYDKTYGAIGGVIVMLLWLWILNMSLLFGAEFDAEMERGRQLQAGIEAEETHPAAAPRHEEERQAPGEGRGRHPARARTAREVQLRQTTRHRQGRQRQNDSRDRLSPGARRPVSRARQPLTRTAASAPSVRR